MPKNPKSIARRVYTRGVWYFGFLRTLKKFFVSFYFLCLPYPSQVDLYSSVFQNAQKNPPLGHTRQAKEVSFVQRESKLTGSLFFSAIISACFSGKTPTLEDICCYLHNKIEIIKQALNERINDHTVDFLSAMFSKAQNQLYLAASATTMKRLGKSISKSPLSAIPVIGSRSIPISTPMTLIFNAYSKV